MASRSIKRRNISSFSENLDDPYIRFLKGKKETDIANQQWKLEKKRLDLETKRAKDVLDAKAKRQQLSDLKKTNYQLMNIKAYISAWENKQIDEKPHIAYLYQTYGEPNMNHMTQEHIYLNSTKESDKRIAESRRELLEVIGDEYKNACEVYEEAVELGFSSRIPEDELIERVVDSGNFGVRHEKVKELALNFKLHRVRRKKDFTDTVVPYIVHCLVNKKPMPKLLQHKIDQYYLLGLITHQHNVAKSQNMEITDDGFDQMLAVATFPIPVNLELTEFSTAEHRVILRARVPLMLINRLIKNPLEFLSIVTSKQLNES